MSEEETEPVTAEFDATTQYLITHRLHSDTLLVMAVYSEDESEELTPAVINTNMLIVDRQDRDFLVQVSSNAATYGEMVPALDAG